MTRDLRGLLVEADALLRREAAIEARALLQDAARADATVANSAEYHALLGQACQRAGDPATAYAALTEALDRKPKWPQVLHLRALALRDLGRVDAARADVVAALALTPQDARAWTTLGILDFRRGRLDDARTALQRAIALRASHAPAWRALAETLQAADAVEPALDAWRRWIQLSPDDPGAPAQFGAALMRAHRWAEAESMLASAAASTDATLETFVHLGHVRAEQGDAAGALATFADASRRWPLRLTPLVATKLFLPQVYESSEDVAAWRDRYEQGLAALETALPSLVSKRASPRDLDWTNFYLAYQGEDDTDLQRRYAAFVARLVQATEGQWPRDADRAEREGLRALPEASRPGLRARLRVGFASSFFHTCTIGAYFGAWPGGLDRGRFEVFVFHYGHVIDATTEAIRAAVEHFVRTPSTVPDIARVIRAADLDVLVYPQLGMDGRDATLAALRLALVQCAAWGHPETTGSAAIDAFISVAGMEPADAESHYSERLVRLPGIGTRYARPAVRPSQRAEFGLPDNRRLYACPQSLFKIHPENDAILARVLVRDRDGAVVVCGDWEQPSATRFRARLAGVLDDHGVDPSRLCLQPLRAPSEFRAMLAACDVMVDTTRWSGGNTALDALAAGLPIVACEGALMRGRQSAAMLRSIGLEALVVERPSLLPERAADVAMDARRYRHHVLAHLGALFERDEPIAALADALVALTKVQAGTSRGA